MASGHVNRIKRPNTWLHRPMLQNVKKGLANPEPSTHDPQRTWVGEDFVMGVRSDSWSKLHRLIFTDAQISRPNALAILRLITSSNLAGGTADLRRWLHSCGTLSARPH